MTIVVRQNQRNEISQSFKYQSEVEFRLLTSQLHSAAESSSWVVREAGSGRATIESGQSRALQR